MSVRRRRLFVMIVVAGATTIGLACSFPDVTFEPLVARAPGDADTADVDGGSAANDEDAGLPTDVDPNGADATVAEATNYDALRALLSGLAIYRFPWVDRTDDLSALAAAAAGSGLDGLLRAETPVPTAPGTIFLD